jgi:hypothetical protein
VARLRWPESDTGPSRASRHGPIYGYTTNPTNPITVPNQLFATSPQISFHKTIITDGNTTESTESFILQLTVHIQQRKRALSVPVSVSAVAKLLPYCCARQPGLRATRCAGRTYVSIDRLNSSTLGKAIGSVAVQSSD